MEFFPLFLKIKVRPQSYWSYLWWWCPCFWYSLHNLVAKSQGEVVEPEITAFVFICRCPTLSVSLLLLLVICVLIYLALSQESNLTYRQVLYNWFYLKSRLFSLWGRVMNSMVYLGQQRTQQDLHCQISNNRNKSRCHLNVLYFAHIPTRYSFLPRYPALISQIIPCLVALEL